jgi:hypothetical protein
MTCVFCVYGNVHMPANSGKLPTCLPRWAPVGPRETSLVVVLASPLIYGGFQFRFGNISAFR